MTSVAGVQTVAAAAYKSHHVLQEIAHELRQPLSAIESIAYYLTLVLPPADDKAREHVSRIQHLIEQSNWILASGLLLSDDSPLAPERVDLEEMVAEAVAGRGIPGSSPVHLNLAGDLPPASLDPGRGRALLEGLLTLCEQIATPEYPIHLRTGRDGERLFLEFRTGAPGYRSDLTLGPGAVLCLAAAKRIAEAHGGIFAVHVDPMSGVQIRIDLTAS